MALLEVRMQHKSDTTEMEMEAEEMRIQTTLPWCFWWTLRESSINRWHRQTHLRASWITAKGLLVSRSLR